MVTSSYDSGIGSGSSYHLNGMSTTANFVSSFDKNNFTPQDETLVSSSVEDSPLDLCYKKFDDLNHTPSQESLTYFSNNKTPDGQTLNMALSPLSINNGCEGTSRKLEHHLVPCQYKRKCSSPCLGMKKLQISSQSLPPKFTQEFEQDGGYRYNIIIHHSIVCTHATLLLSYF